MTKSEMMKLVYRHKFQQFASFAFRELFPATTLNHNWHVDLFIVKIMSCLDGSVTRGIINAPPRTLKSFVASVAYPAFALAHNPSLKIVVVAGNRKLAKDIEHAIRTLLRSQQYLELFPHMRFDTRRPQIHLAGGGQISFTVYGKSVIGRGFDIIITDDPYSPSVAADDASRREANEWFAAELLPRLNNRSKSIVLVLMQRLHREDLTGVLVRSRERWDHTCLPAIATKDEQWRMPNGTIYTRGKGELLHPLLLTSDDLLTALNELDAVNFMAQYQQETFLRSNFRTGFFKPSRYNAEWYANWTPEAGCENGYMGSIPEAKYIRHELFGIGDAPDQIFESQLTAEQFFCAFELHQARLVASA